MSKKKASPLGSYALFAVIAAAIFGGLAYQAFSQSQPSSTDGGQSAQIPLGTSNITQPSQIQGTSPSSSVYSPQSAATLTPSQLQNLSL